MRTLNELNNHEQKLLQILESVEGTIEAKLKILENLPVSEQYEQIHFEYATMSRSSMEALKRGLFLIWYSRLEPEFMSGISTLRQEAIDELFTYTIWRLENNDIDAELAWMLSYYANWDFLFADNHTLHTHLIERQKTVRPQIDAAQMVDRGTMGLYWTTLDLNV
jgi:hypothetical protein